MIGNGVRAGQVESEVGGTARHPGARRGGPDSRSSKSSRRAASSRRVISRRASWWPSTPAATTSSTARSTASPASTERLGLLGAAPHDRQVTPEPPGGRQVQLDERPQRHPVERGPPALEAEAVQLLAGQAPMVARDLGDDLEVVGEQGGIEPARVGCGRGRDGADRAAGLARADRSAG